MAYLSVSVYGVEVIEEAQTGDNTLLTGHVITQPTTTQYSDAAVSALQRDRL